MKRAAPSLQPDDVIEILDDSTEDDADEEPPPPPKRHKAAAPDADAAARGGASPPGAVSTSLLLQGMMRPCGPGQQPQARGASDGAPALLSPGQQLRREASEEPPVSLPRGQARLLSGGPARQPALADHHPSASQAAPPSQAARRPGSGRWERWPMEGHENQRRVPRCPPCISQLCLANPYMLTFQIYTNCVLLSHPSISGYNDVATHQLACILGPSL